MVPGMPASVGRYRILGEIGRGAMGAVYRAEDPKLGRAVAVKMISAAVASGLDRDEISARFEREARVAARLHDPHVVAIHDVGSEGDSLYLVMELVEGDSLAQRLSRGDFPSATEALSIAAQAADALAAAHEAGVIHRDIKPANLLIARDGRIKVSDFGVAKAIGERTDLTRTGMMVGSPAYMAPEQVKGMTLDGRSDLFSLGVVLFEMLLRRKPFPADTVTTLVYQILHEDPLEDVSLTSVLGPKLAEFLRWTLAKDREARIPDARTFAQRARALAAAGGGAPTETAPTELMPAPSAPPASVAPASPAVQEARPHEPGPVAPTAPPRRSPLLVGSAFGAVLVVAIVATAWLTRSPAPPEVGGQTPAPLGARPLAQPEPPESGAASEPDPAPAVAPAEPEPTSPPPAAEVRAEPPQALAAPPAEESPAPEPERLAAASAPADEVVPAPSPEPAGTPEPAPAAPVIPISAVFEARRAAEFHVEPEDAMVEVDGRKIGIADDWDDMGGGKEFVFPGPGEYVVKLSLDGYRTTWIKIVVRPGAEEDVADVDTELPEIEN